MRNFYFLPLSLVFTLQAQAQPKTFGAFQLPAHIQTIIEQQQPPAAEKTSVMKQRIIAHVMTLPGFGIDSFAVSYSGLRGSGNIPLGYIPNTWFDPLGAPPVMADTQARYSQAQTSTTRPLIYRYKDHFLYDAANRMTLSTLYGGSTNFLRYTYAYNAAGYPTTATTSSSPTEHGTYTPVQLRVFRHNSANKLILDSMRSVTTGAPQNKRQYTYDASNRTRTNTYHQWNTSTNAWRTVDSSSYSYYSSGMLRSTVNVGSSGTTPTYRLDSLEYAGAQTVPNRIYSYSGTSAAGPWTPVSQQVSTVNAAGNNYTQHIRNTWNGSAFVPEGKGVGIFNTDGTVRRVDNFGYTGGVQNTTPEYFMEYYYQQYNDPTGVQTGKEWGALRLYPNPAHDYLQVETGRQAGGQAQVLDAAGRTVISWKFLDAGIQGIDVHALSPGAYWLQISDTKGQPLGLRNFVKR